MYLLPEAMLLRSGLYMYVHTNFQCYISLLVSSMYTVVMCMLVIVALPIVVGVCSMALLPRQHVEYN